MNERIFKMIQAQNGNRGLLWTESDKEEFAELIVRECMNLVKDCYAEPESGQSLYQTACASTIIEDHFGIEE